MDKPQVPTNAPKTGEQPHPSKQAQPQPQKQAQPQKTPYQSAPAKKPADKR